jgi:predicted nucleotidyltransferase
MSRHSQLDSRPSGRFLLRLEPGLHAALRSAAADAGLSLNAYCARKLAAPLGSLAAVDEAAGAVTTVANHFGDALVGVVIFGSWVRDELTSDSDVDLLVVVAPNVPLERELYRRWDREPVHWEGRPVEPLFVHLPDPRDRASGLWAEVATEGIVLFERALAVSKVLLQIRRDIARGLLVRGTAHGHPYWAEVA